jgi:hypothetical protein
MSFFGFDLLTDVSVGRYMSGDFDCDEGRNDPVDNADEPEEQPQNQEPALSRSPASASSNGSNAGSGLWNHTDYGYFTHATTTARTPPDVPVTIDLRHPLITTATATDEMEAEDASSILTSDELQSNTGGITILSAVPSEDIEENVNSFYTTAQFPVQSLDILAISPHSAGFFSNSHHQNQHALSISTTESLYQLQQHQQHHSSSSSSSSSSGFLSLNPSSLASSVMTSNMAISFSDSSSYHSISRPFSAAVLSAAVSGRRASGGVGGMDNYQPTIALMPAASPSTTSTLTQQQQPWYARFTEADWERTLQVLTALGGEEDQDEGTRMMCPDMLAALLIEQEEELFWNKNKNKKKKKRCSSWQQVLVLPSTWSTMATTSACWRILATAATLSLGATATLLMSGSRRRAEQETSRRVEA